MTRKVTPEQRRMRRDVWALREMTRAINRTRSTMQDATASMLELGYALSGKYPAYGRKETPARSAMHRAYGRRRNG